MHDTGGIRRDAHAGSDAIARRLGTAPTTNLVAFVSQATHAAISVMREARVCRLPAVTDIGAKDSRGHGGFQRDPLFQPLLLRIIDAAKGRQEATICSAQHLRWTSIRLGLLIDEAPTGRTRARTPLAQVDVAGLITRAGVAYHLAETLEKELRQSLTALPDAFLARL